ncbi:MAG: bifunctional (p)ppGpp synthetase/guanosine-3',5'-bis(diphosphate) 3'-pyrophosphohydrolase [SAR202 cluster bacterium]|nr:bifunctional (p)ppGpp synthetase/guanosine-3',5'-bis(diphosphate) 3'-pyrophosphohydrolase [SAR202 cluster bacterium]
MQVAQALLEKVRKSLPPEKAALVRDALEYAQQAHQGQNRRSGEPYIEHPVNVASFLADLDLDATTISAALLHDVVEDCGVSVEELGRRFGSDVARLVDGVTKLTKLDKLTDPSSPITPRKDGTQAESIRKMLIAMAEDIRVVLIKLADRLHNMKTLSVMPPERRVAISQETLDIYAPLAHRLGMGEIKWQLEDLSFRYLQPNQYRAISKLLNTKRQEREAFVQQVTEVLRREIANAGFQAEVYGRPKHIYSIYRKAQAYAAQGKEISDIYDLFAVRILVPSIQDCYGVLGVVHSLWRPVPGQFDDYIASPKENMYQSLHTSVRAINGVPLEVQVRTYQMHVFAEYGVAAHWRYKEGAGAGTSKALKFEEKMTWLRQLLEWQRDLSGAEEFLESVKTDIFNDQVFVYTPKNDIKELPAGSTPIDFAYHIHTELGHRCIGAKVNGKLVSLDTQLKSGDTVEILTSKVARGPSLDWLNPHLGFVRTATARQSIRGWFRRQERASNILRGRELLKKETRRFSVAFEDAEIAKMFGMDALDDFYAALGSGLLSITQVSARLSSKPEAPPSVLDTQPETLPEAPSAGITVLGVGDLLTRMAQCCHPLPGDEIVGFITRLRGVTVHRKDCSNVRNVSDRDRLVPVSWGSTKDLFPVRLRIEAWDRVGLLHDITGAMSGEGANILNATTEVSADGTVSILCTIQVSSMAQLSRVFSHVESVRAVRSIVRLNHGEEPLQGAAAKGKPASQTRPATA